MKRIKMKLKSIYVFSVGMLIMLSFHDANAQIQMGKAGMSLEVDEETAQLTSDMINRRVVISPTHRTVTKDSTIIIIKLNNPTGDTLIVNLYFSDTLVKSSWIVLSEAPIDTANSHSRGKGFLQSDRTDSASSIVRSMVSWLREIPKSIAILPGEKKSITVKIEIPDTVLDGEYISWIVAEVQPRKKTPGSTKMAYTTSTAKISYKSESDNIDAKSSR